MIINPLLIISITTLLASTAFADTYKDFEPGMTLKQVKVLYPNANFHDTKAAWVQPDSVFLKMTGVGFVGSVHLKLSHSDAWHNRELEKAEQVLNTSAEAKSIIESTWKVEYHKKQLALPLEERLGLDWLRWTPDVALPYERVVGRFGKPTKCDYNEESFLPYCVWEARGIVAAMSENKSRVYSLEYSFTSADWDAVNKKMDK